FIESSTYKLFWRCISIWHNISSSLVGKIGAHGNLEYDWGVKINCTDKCENVSLQHGPGVRVCTEERRGEAHGTGAKRHLLSTEPNGNPLQHE
uniref:Uncharacterized protein n=1 Tax=Ciona savignyi TaxID=51511 RepID=H2Y761_CIOSA